MVVLGVFLLAVGGFAAGSFYIPFKAVRKWAWESYWLVGGVFSWIIAPIIVACITVGGVRDVLAEVPASCLFYTYLFGLLWGIGGLTFGLSVRYLGMSLGYAIALGFCAGCGFIVPPIFKGELAELIGTTGGQVILGGVVVSLLGIAICGAAGMRKEHELSPEQKRASIKEFAFIKGIAVAVFAGVMSSFMAFIIAFSNIWALLLKEWKGSSRRTIITIIAGIAIVVASIIIIGYGNNLAIVG